MPFFGRTLGRIQAQRDATSRYLANPTSRYLAFQTGNRSLVRRLQDFDKDSLSSNTTHDLSDEAEIDIQAQQQFQGEDDSAIEEEGIEKVSASELADNSEQPETSPYVSMRAENGATKDNQ